MTDIEILEEHYKKKKPTNLNRYKFEDYNDAIENIHGHKADAQNISYYYPDEIYGDY